MCFDLQDYVGYDLLLLLLNDLFSVENVCILCFCIIDLNGHEMLWLFGYKKTLGPCPKESMISC